MVIDDLCDEPCEREIAISMFFCDFRDQREQKTTNIVGAILKQLVVRGEVLEHVRKGEKRSRRPRSATSGYGVDAEAGCCRTTQGVYLY